MSSINAMEDLCGVEVSEPIQILRRLLYCGEWIESHALHVYMLHAPDFLGYAGAVEMAREHADVVAAGTVPEEDGQRVDDRHRRPRDPSREREGRRFLPRAEEAELRELVEPLERAREAALETVRWTAGFEFPERAVECELVALAEPGAYAIESGRVVSDRGLDVGVDEYDGHFFEEHVERSNALHSRRADGSTYLCGPLARYALSADRLSPLAREVAGEVGPRGPLPRRLPEHRRPQRRARLRLRRGAPADRRVRGAGRAGGDVEPRAGVGHGATEAPRGLLYHRYELDADGTILDAKIVPPTSQNQLAIEEDLRQVVERYHELSDDELRHVCEQAIRNFDPCISCATHFLDLEIVRE